MADTIMNIDHLGGQRYVGRNAAGDQILIDAESPAIGVRPMEALLAALGTCTAFDVVEILAKRRTPVQTYRIELEGTRAEEHPRRYTHIKVRHIVGGEGVTQKSLEWAVELSHEKYCSVVASLNSEIEAEAVLDENTSDHHTGARD